MGLLAEYALTPSVFSPESFESASVHDLHLRYLSDVMRTEAVVRNLRDGHWRDFVRQSGVSPKAKELLRKLSTRGRLHIVPSELDSNPTTEHEWLHEALASHRTRRLDGVIISDALREMPKDDPVSACNKIDSADWWRRRSPSVRLRRTVEEYVLHLQLVMQTANSVMFIDPHLNPSVDRYAHCASLLAMAGGRTPPPKVEIHRVCYQGSGPDRKFPSLDQIHAWFSGRFREDLSAAGLKAEIFVWDDFHDRFLITNLIGINLASGFDIDWQKDHTVWSRLDRDDADAIQREFDPSSHEHHLRFRFEIG